MASRWDGLTCRLLVLWLLASSVAACGSRAPTTDVRTAEPTALVREVRRIYLDSGSDMDVYASPALSGAPVAVVLHGGSDEGLAQLEPFASELAARGTVVFVPEWPAITDLSGFAASPESSLVDQTVGVICALREAKATAVEFGGVDNRVALVATSQAGAVAVRVALSAGEAWPEAGCRPTVDHRPDLLVGLAGNYSGSQYRGLVTPIDVWDRFDPFRFVDQRLLDSAVFIHGLDDTSVLPQESERASETLIEAGHDSVLVQLPGEHASLIRPSTPAGAFSITIITELLHDHRRARLHQRPVIDMLYGQDGCQVATSPIVSPNEPFEVVLTNESREEAWLLVFRVDDWAAIQPVLHSPNGQRFETHPPFMGSVALRILAPKTTDSAVIVAEVPEEWFLACAVPEDTRMTFRMLAGGQLANP